MQVELQYVGQVKKQNAMYKRIWPHEWHEDLLTRSRNKARELTADSIENLEKIVPGPSEIESRGLRNWVRRPLRRHFPKTFNLRWLLEGCIFMSGKHFEPTWLHLGGPRGSKIKAQTWKNRCWKTIRFRHRFWRRSGLVLQAFLKRFLNGKIMKIAETRF